MQQQSKPTPIVCFGDSLSEAINEAEINKWPTRLQVLLDGWRPGAFATYNRGISGNTSANALDRIDGALLNLMPGWVLVEFGGNDANIRPNRRTHRVSVEEFSRNLREIHRMVTEAGGRCAFVAMHFMLPDNRTPEQGRKYDQGNGKTFAENYRPYHDQLLAIAKDLGCPSLDVPAIIERDGIDTSRLLINDGIHLTTEGNLFYARTVFEWLKTFLCDVR